MREKPNNFDIISALDLLEEHLERGEYLKKQDGLWWIFDEDGEGVTSGRTLRDILISLIFIDC